MRSTRLNEEANLRFSEVLHWAQTFSFEAVARCGVDGRPLWADWDFDNRMSKLPLGSRASGFHRQT